MNMTTPDLSIFATSFTLWYLKACQLLFLLFVKPIPYPGRPPLLIWESSKWNSDQFMKLLISLVPQVMCPSSQLSTALLLVGVIMTLAKGEGRLYYNS